MDANDVGPGSAGIVTGAVEVDGDAPRPSLLGSSWRGAKAGFRWVSYVIGPVAMVMAILCLGLAALGLWDGGVRPVIATLFNALGLYVVFAAWGGIIGAAIGLVVGAIRRVWPGAFRWSWWGAFHRPIRLFRRGEVASAHAATARSRFRRWHRFVIGSILFLLVAAVGIVGYLAYVVDRRLADAIAAADREDPYWRVDDLMAHREPVPDAENAALVVAEALGRLPDDWCSTPEAPPGSPKPPPTDLMKAYGRIGATPENVRLDDGVVVVLRDELETYEDAVRIARTVADYRRGRHELELGPTLIDTRLPETQATRTATRLMSADAAVRAHDGDLDGALDSCRAMLGVGRSIGDEPFLVSQLVRVAIGQVATQSARRVLGQGEPSDAAMARLQSLILDELAQPLLLHGMRGERATMTELIRRVGSGEVPISAISSGSPEFDAAAERAVIAPWGRLLFKNQRAVALEWTHGAVAIARRPVAERPPLWVSWQAEVDRVRLSRLGPFTATLALLMTPALAASGSAHARHACDLGATAILLAAERHRRKAGEWPASIADIDPSILPSAPVDPYSGRAFRMEHRDGRLFIYSIGPNGKDEHGAYDPRKWMKGTTDDDVGAIGWDVPLRRRSPRAEDEAVRSKPSP